MKLYYTPTSPFARKVRIAAYELEINSQISLVLLNPWTDDNIRLLNPLGKIPILQLEDDSIMVESTIICDYLNEKANGLLFPTGNSRFDALQLQALADGVSMAAARLFMDSTRPENERSEAVMERQQQAIESTLDYFNQHAGHYSISLPSIGEISLISALGYLTFRFAEFDWFEMRPALSHWFQKMEERPSVMTTKPYIS